MVTGIECAGLVLAVLPLFVEAAKSYKKGVDTIYDIISHSRRDEKLEEFYEEFWWETALLNRQIRGIVVALPSLSDDRKTYLATAEHLEIMFKIMGLLVQLVKDSTVHISKTDADQTTMYNKLKGFGTDRRNRQTSSSFEERLRFWRKDKDRDKCLKALRKWNKRLYHLIEEAQKEPVANNASASMRKIPSYSLRVISQMVFSALSKCWSCDCDIPHEAKFCLKTDGDQSKNADGTDINFDFLFSAAIETGRWTWQEGLVLVRSRGDENEDDRAVLRRLCDAIHGSGGNNHCLQLLINSLDRAETIWQLRSQPRRTSYVETIPAVSLQTLLLRPTPLPLRVKRRLALIFANSLLHLHEGLWLGREWNKRQISFFYESVDKPDYQRPYLSTSFDNPSFDLAASNLNVFHRNLSILALGILLIELHTEKPIESYRSVNDLMNGQDANENTDLTVANRVAKSLDDCSYNYQKAIQACLDTPWAAAGQRVSLDDPVITNGIYNDVVRPLEDEIAYLFREVV